MTPEEREQVVKRLRSEQDSIRTSKGKSYAGTADALANFKEVAERSGQSKYQVWLVYFLKHVMAIENAIKNNATLPVEASEGLSGRINDVMIYAELLACLAQEDGLLSEGIQQVFGLHPDEVEVKRWEEQLPVDPGLLDQLH